MYTANLVRERRSENEFWVDKFIVSDDVASPEKALREAVAEYLSTDDGKKQTEDTNYDFNWGDAIMFVPDAIWQKHGLLPARDGSKDVRVDQDEVLCGSRYDDKE